MRGLENYKQFLEKKFHSKGGNGFSPVFMPDFLFGFQQHLVQWALKMGRAAIFADCGLGKTAMQLVWAQNIVEKTNKNILILTPLAVSGQSASEGEKFGIECAVSRDGKPAKKITITNYEKLHLFNWQNYEAVVCDESSILKNFDGARKDEITQFLRKVKYRLLCTATAAPNDYTELGTSSEALGYLGYMDMLNKFFKNDQNNSSTKRLYGKQMTWRFKGHAEDAYWRWVTSWARAIQKPSDLAFDDEGFQLPGLEEIDCVIDINKPKPGMLFSVPAVGQSEERDELKRTIFERCEQVSKLASHNDFSLIWCNLNPEGDLLEKIIPGAVQVAGKHSDEEKEERLTAFAKGQIKKLIIKPKIGAWGLNFQHCNHLTYFPTHSYEQYYQAVRRCLRFGQKRKVRVDRVSTEAQQYVLKSMSHKSRQAEKMFARLIEHMSASLSIKNIREFSEKELLPSWL